MQAADACQAFLQAPLRSPVPTYVALPSELWLPQWRGRFRRVAVRLKRALYGHPEAPAEWQAYLENVLKTVLLAVAAEGFPSIFWLPTLCVLVTIYVDDILAAGRAEGLKGFWSQLREHIDLDEVSSVERFLAESGSLPLVFRRRNNSLYADVCTCTAGYRSVPVAARCDAIEVGNHTLRS